MNFTMNIHRVKSIELSPSRHIQSNGTRYATRDLTIETDDGSFELTLFSVYAKNEDDAPLLEVRA